MVATLEVETRRVVTPDTLPFEIYEEESARARGLFVIGTLGSEYVSLRDEFRDHAGDSKRPRNNDLLLKVEYQGKTIETVTHGLAYFVRDLKQVRTYSSKSPNFSKSFLVDGEKSEGLMALVKRLAGENKIGKGIHIHDALAGHEFQFHELKGSPTIHPYLSRRDLVAS